MSVVENRKKLARALRSGKYKQGTLRLCSPITESYCCLGVACEVAIKNGVKLKKKRNGSSVLYYTEDESSPSNLSFSNVRRFYGFKSIDGKIKPQFFDKMNKYLKRCGFDNLCRLYSLIQLNDYGVKFKHTAHIIEMGWVQ